MRTIIWFAYFWTYIVAIVPKMLSMEKRKNNGENILPQINVFIRVWATRLLRLAGARVTVQGLANIPSDAPVLFVANHSGYFDIPLLLAYLDDVHPLVAKKELAKLPLINHWMRLFDCLFIDRKNPRQSVAVLSQAGKLIEQGKSVCIFPEGTRSKTSDVAEFKSGAFKIAEKTRAVIVPVVISGTRDLMENNNYFIRPAKVSMKILPGVITQEFAKSDFKELPEKVRAMIQNELK